MCSDSDVAVGTGNSSAVRLMFSPQPATTWSPIRSASSPATLPLAICTSLGHFRTTSIPVSWRRPSTTPMPMTRGTSAIASSGGESATENDNVPLGDDQDRPSLPRPAVCCAAAITVPAGAEPARTRSARSAFVDPVTPTTITSRQGTCHSPRS